MGPARLAAAVLVAASLPGCWSGSRRDVADKPEPTVALPGWAVAACASVPVLRGACVDRKAPGRGGFWQMFIERPGPPSRVAYVVVRHGSDAMAVGAAPARGGVRAFGLAPAVRRPVSDRLSVYTGTAVDGGPHPCRPRAGGQVDPRAVIPAAASSRSAPLTSGLGAASG